jgi:signal transduction histidine kinase
MNPAAKGARRWLVPLLIFALGTGGSWSLSQAFRQDAWRAWQAQVEQTAHALSGTLLGWLEESYAPLSGLGILAENSTTLNEVEFLNGFDGLESRATAFFLDSVAYLHLDADEKLQLIYSTDASGPLASGSPSTELDQFIPTVKAAFERSGRILLGPPFQLEAGTTVSTVALSIIEPNGRAAVVLGLVNYDAMIDGLIEQLVPVGLTLQMSGKFFGGDSVPVYTDTRNAILHTVTTRTISAGADLSISWNASAEFKGGVADKLANLTLLAGVLVSAIIALFIGTLLRRNLVILQRIQDATLELERSKDAADAANQAKSEFLANMSHELRTPMNAILGYSEMLIEEAEDADQKDFIPDLEKINQAGTHLLSLINDVLDLSKIESGKMEAFPEDVILNNLIDEVAATTHPLLVKNGNKLAVERGRNLGSAFQDLTKLRQVLLNLMSNAAKFTHKGTVTLHANRLSREDGDWLTLAVSDTGIGIEADMLERIFEEFSQADNSTTRDYGGTGLGLTIARRFCKLLGGNLDVYSEPGLGSTFTVRIPADLPDLLMSVSSSQS